MVEMMTSLRTYQSDQQAVQTINQTLGEGIQAGRPLKSVHRPVDHWAVREGPQAGLLRRSPGRPPMAASHPSSHSTEKD